MDSRPIGIFDSGVGGLTVAKEIRRLLPNESTIYVGDTARVPYGTKTPQELLRFSREIVHFLLDKNVKAVVLACGTSSSVTYEQLLTDFPDLPLVDVIRPAVNVCVQMLNIRPNMRFGLIATAATIKSGLFARLLAEKCPGATLHPRACPLFASMVEAGLDTNHPALRIAVENYMSDLRGQIDTLVLGCTHYPLLTDALTATLGNVEFINIGEATAVATKERLAQNGILAEENSNPTHSYYVSGPADVFRTTGGVILGEDCTPVQVGW